jgi:serine/threonine protein kinase
MSSKTVGERYEILRTLGSGGSCKVKLALDRETRQKVAVKIMNDDMGEEEKKLLANEVQTMVELNHDNVVNYIEWGTADYSKPSGSKKVDYISLELAEKGELFDFISSSGPFSENTARHFFK